MARGDAEERRPDHARAAREGGDMSERYEGPRGGGWADGLPVWARVVALVGTPSLIAIGLAWALQRDLPATRLEISVMHQAVSYNRTLLEQQSRQMDSQLRLLRWICSNTAKPGETQRCFD